MKKSFLTGSLLAALLLLPVLSRVQAADLQIIKLNEPDKKRGLPVMQALSVRASVRQWSDRELSLQDLSDLLWAANGINRPDIKKRTAASAMNAQDVDIYVFRKDGVYLYDSLGHQLGPVVAGDQRSQIPMTPGGRPGERGAEAPKSRVAVSRPAMQACCLECPRSGGFGVAVQSVQHNGRRA